jgi:hypothetical protein
MFDVTAVCPMDGSWQQRDELLYRLAGRRSDASEAGNKSRTHVWRVSTFEDATRLRKKLRRVQSVNVVIQETVSQG